MVNRNSKLVPDPTIESIYEILKRYVLIKTKTSVKRTTFKCVKFYNLEILDKTSSN